MGTLPSDWVMAVGWPGFYLEIMNKGFWIHKTLFFFSWYFTLSCKTSIWKSSKGANAFARYCTGYIPFKGKAKSSHNKGFSSKQRVFMGDRRPKGTWINYPPLPLLPSPLFPCSFHPHSLPFTLDLFLFIFDPGLVCSSSAFNPSRCILWQINHLRVFR